MPSMMELGGNKPVRARSKIRNAETSITILKGSPSFYKMNATNDGFDALSAEAIAAANQGFFAGIAMQDIAPGKIRETQVHGVCSYTRVVTATRPTTTDAWVSYPAGVLGDVLAVSSGAGIQALVRVGAGSSNVFPAFALGVAYASATTQASSVGAGVVSVSSLTVFIRTI